MALHRILFAKLPHQSKRSELCITVKGSIRHFVFQSNHNLLKTEKITVWSKQFVSSSSTVHTCSIFPIRRDGILYIYQSMITSCGVYIIFRGEDEHLIFEILQRLPSSIQIK